MEKGIADIKARFVKYISDTNEPLDERWKFFIEAPSYIKEHETYIHTFNWEAKYKEISWYDDFYSDRYSVVDVDTVIDSMLDKYDEYTTQMVIDMKEEILSINLGSFIMDW